MNKHNTLCSIKGCKYTASVKTILDNREYRMCHKHKYLMLVSILKWESVKQ